jgi:hypothetical protein
VPGEEGCVDLLLLLPAVGGHGRVPLLPPGQGVCPDAGGADPMGRGRGSLHVIGGQVADAVHLVPPIN